jgi:hypothetical protein
MAISERVAETFDMTCPNAEHVSGANENGPQEHPA